jgi:hypothetical protein
MHMTLEVAREKVAAGVAYLDDLPLADNWRARIDPVRFSLGSPQRCVLGQLFGNYYDATHDLGLSAAKQSHYGFMYWGEDHSNILLHEAREDKQSWVNLEAAWLEEIA